MSFGGRLRDGEPESGAVAVPLPRVPAEEATEQLRLVPLRDSRDPDRSR